MTEHRHFLDQGLLTSKISVALVGCGGNGGQMLMGLASIDTALRATTPRSLDVTVIDDDIVSTANLGRQPFYSCDIGRSKAHVLTERVNVAHGLNWKSIKGRAPDAIPDWNHLIITCVDSAASRRAVHYALKKQRSSVYWLDLGNRARDGQFILGRTRYGGSDKSLPTVMDHFPELLDDSIPEDDAPSCSMADALAKQSLFVNRVVASNALALLWELLGRGSIGYQGQFINLESGQAVAIPLPREEPAIGG